MSTDEEKPVQAVANSEPVSNTAEQSLKSPGPQVATTTAAAAAVPTLTSVAATDANALEADDNEEEEDVLDDGDSALGSTHSSTTSLRDEMIQLKRENGRSYQGYMEAKYVLPMDEEEYERLDFQCHLVYLTLDKHHTFIPLKNPSRVLDIGCGTGIWAIEYADENPGTEVLGVDLVPCQPQCVPPNLQFEIDDLEQPWSFSRKFDHIHCQLMIGGIQDWPKLFKQSFDFLEPNGYFEIHDCDFQLRCDDGSLPPDCALARWDGLMAEGARKAGFPLDAIESVPTMFRDAGFEDVVAVPYKWPINSWPKDEKYKLVGNWTNENFVWGCESMSLALLTRVLGWSIDEVRVLMTQVRKDLKNKKYHAYWNFWVVYGRRPA